MQLVVVVTRTGERVGRPMMPVRVACWAVARGMAQWG